MVFRRNDKTHLSTVWALVGGITSRKNPDPESGKSPNYAPGLTPVASGCCLLWHYTAVTPMASRWPAELIAPKPIRQLRELKSILLPDISIMRGIRFAERSDPERNAFPGLELSVLQRSGGLVFFWQKRKCRKWSTEQVSSTNGAISVIKKDWKRERENGGKSSSRCLVP